MTIISGDLSDHDTPGDLEFPFRWVEGEEWYIQKLRQRFTFFLAEWFLDLREGIPFFRDVFIKQYSLPTIRSIFRQVIESIDGTDQIKKFDVTVDDKTRILSFDFHVKVNVDGTIVDVIQPAFIIGIP